MESVTIGMTMEDIREYESQMHAETNKIVGSTAEATTGPGPAADSEPIASSATAAEMAASCQLDDVTEKTTCVD